MPAEGSDPVVQAAQTWLVASTTPAPRRLAAQAQSEAQEARGQRPGRTDWQTAVASTHLPRRATPPRMRAPHLLPPQWQAPHLLPPTLHLCCRCAPAAADAAAPQPKAKRKKVVVHEGS